MSTQAAVFDGADADRELVALHPALTTSGFVQVLRAGILALGQTTANDSPCWRGGQPRGHMIRTIRDWLCPIGWMKSDTLNLALVEHSGAGIAIAITPGDHNTGRRGTDDPRSRNPRGEVTIGKVQLNQLSFMEQLVGPDRIEKSPQLWVLLFNIEEAVADAEISLPLAVGDDDRIVEWSKRILLPRVDISEPELMYRPEDEPVLDVSVRRKSKE